MSRQVAINTESTKNPGNAILYDTVRLVCRTMSNESVNK